MWAEHQWRPLVAYGGRWRRCDRCEAIVPHEQTDYDETPCRGRPGPPPPPRCPDCEQVCDEACQRFACCGDCYERQRGGD